MNFENDDGMLVEPGLSDDYRSFEELCAENAGQEFLYFDMVKTRPLEMDSVTLAFCLRHLVRLSQEVLEVLLASLDGESDVTLGTVLDLKGIQLDKSRAAELRNIVFSFRDCQESEIQGQFVRALQLLTINRLRRRVRLNLGETYTTPEEGWTLEDFGGDDSLLDTVRAIEDPAWTKNEEL
jgi:hypothetical protein